MGKNISKGLDGNRIDLVGIDLTEVPTPCYILDEAAFERNLNLLGSVQDRCGCKILLALKGFAAFSLFPLICRHLSGVAASSLDEARLGSEEFGGEVHVCAPAYREDEFDLLLGYADHIVFNSFSQLDRFRPNIEAARRSGKRVRCGIRVNPEHREVKVPIYDPCGPYSRLGTTLTSFRAAVGDGGGEGGAGCDDHRLAGISGLHFHNLCELGADSLQRTLAVFEERFGGYLERMEWVNFGGGHHITRPGYDLNLLCDLINDFQDRHPLEVYLEPGEAVALNAGFFVAEVLDVVENGMEIAILDTSAAAHMPDVLEMPYRPQIVGAGLPGEYPHTYRLGGMTCLAGDVIGDYSFPQPLEVGDRVVFLDMAHYTMVKNTTFNGMRLPTIAIRDLRGEIRVVRRFGYEDYRSRLS
ncbi:carboxynorspermidine decarboxylase [Methanocrinis sp.]|uniref:carboxynorspermidine decarboxylase n=1 Tax=Methanocrinis sp. TaxID=3101522 RepID=UPI003D147D18